MNVTERKDCSATGFKALMTAQFFGAFNDNVFRLFVSLIILDALLEQQGAVGYLALSEALLVIPFILFSPYAGYFADKYRKSSIIKLMKVMELVVLCLGFYYLTLQSVSGLLFVLFLLGLQSTIFSPCKYGILPEILEEKNLSKGNGYIEFWTFLAIVAGTSIGGLLKAFSAPPYVIPGLFVVSIAGLGLLASFLVPRTETSATKSSFEINFLKSVRSSLIEIKSNKALFLVVIAISYFWAIGALLKLNALVFAKYSLALSDLNTAILFTALAVGIGVGSIVAGIVSEGKVELGLVPLGAAGISIFGILLSVFHGNFLVSLGLLACIGFGGGLFIVPLNSYLQHNSPDESRGQFIAATNFLSFLGVVIACALEWCFVDILGMSATHVFFILGLTTACVSLYIIKLMPDMLVRCINWVFSHTVYRVRVEGRDFVPDSGGALLVCNHVSFVDPSLVLAAIRRPVRFLMYRPIYNSRIVGPIGRVMKAIPVSPTDNPREIAKSLAVARKAVEGGELVCIFAEGAITRTGQLLPFRKGFERIMKGASVPIIPVHIDALWGSIFSFKGGKFVWKFPKKLPYPVTISFGKPLDSSSKADEVRRAVSELGSEAFCYRAEVDKLLHLGFITQARRNPKRLCMVDSSSKSLNYGQVLMRALHMAEHFRKLGSAHDKVGILLPPCAPAAISNIALLLAGRVPVNLNYTAAQGSVTHAIEKCKISNVITNEEFLEKCGLELKVDLIDVATCKSDLSLWSRFRLFAIAFILPISIVPRFLCSSKTESKDLATVIFSSGSTGEPKGVMLSHGNITSNVESICDVCQVKRHDIVMGVLPFFHSFGFTGTLWLPLLAGIGVVYHNNPTDAGTIGDLVERHRATMLMSTPTFLLVYIRKCSKEQFQSLSYVVVGAEKLKPRVAMSFEKKFGIIPREGFGATELSPVAMLNIADYEASDGKQVGEKLGTVGHPIPGVSVRIIDSETHEILSPNVDGLLLVKGPNVMMGYLGDEQRTREVMRDDWYITGDIANVDDDGFVTITDRLSRFSKIGGEMVPHIKVEDEINKLIGYNEPACVVTAVSDDKKGEKLVVLSTVSVDSSQIVKQLTEQGLPNLWIPKKDSFFQIESLPMLGSGKLDLKAIKNYATEVVNKR